MDIKSPEERSKNMAAIHSKNTKPEIYLGVSGTDMKDVNMLTCQNQG